MYCLTVYEDKLYEFEATDEFINSNKDKAKIIIPDMELDSNEDTYLMNKNFFTRVKECINEHKQIPIYFLGDILNNPTGYAEDGTDICGEFLNWFSALENDDVRVIRGNGEMDLVSDGILDASLTKVTEETYMLKFSKGQYPHNIYIKKLSSEDENGMRKRIQETLQKIYGDSTLYELIGEKIILSHAPLLNYQEYYFKTIGDKIIKQTQGKIKNHPTSIAGKEKCYDGIRELFYSDSKIKYNIAGHIPIYDDCNIIKYNNNKFCILTNDEPYYEKFKGKKYYADPGHKFNGTRKIIVLFDNVKPPSSSPLSSKSILIDNTNRYLTGLLQDKKIHGGYSSEIMICEYHEDTFAKLLLFLFVALVIILIVSLITASIYYKSNTNMKQT